MTALTIATSIISVLLIGSRFLMSVKPLWDRLPKAVAVFIPPVVALIPQVVALIQQTKTTQDLVNYLAASVALVVVGLFPKSHEEATDDAVKRQAALKKTSSPAAKSSAKSSAKKKR